MAFLSPLKEPYPIKKKERSCVHICTQRDKGYYVTEKTNSRSTKRSSGSSKVRPPHTLGSTADTYEPDGLFPPRCGSYLAVSGSFLGIFSAACCRGALRVLRTHLLAWGHSG